MRPTHAVLFACRNRRGAVVRFESEDCAVDAERRVGGQRRDDGARRLEDAGAHVSRDRSGRPENVDVGPARFVGIGDERVGEPRFVAAEADGPRVLGSEAAR
jgi:hypothetical protein